MKRRPVNEPQIQFRAPEGLWHNAELNQIAMGCSRCPEYALCGGLNTATPVFDCTSFCSCVDRTQCDMVCRGNARHFVERVREIGGFNLTDLPRVDVVQMPTLPTVVPLLFHGSRRVMHLRAPAIALPLYELVDFQIGQLRVRTRDEVADRFLIDPASRIVLSGVAKDGVIERWWSSPYRTKIIAELRQLDLALVTSPNFSVFTDVPRWDNFHAMKRISLMWTEFMAAGIPTALHINGRTDRDYERWAEFIAARREVTAVAFEFGTGAGWPDRIDWHVARLAAVVRAAGRPLTLVVRGGIHRLEQLRLAFREVVLLETVSFTKTMNRQKAYVHVPGVLRWRRMPTPKAAVLDNLLVWNIDAVRSRALTAFRSSTLARSSARPRLGRGTTDNRNYESRQQRLL